MSWYNYPSNFSNNTGVNGIGDFFSYVHEVSGYWLGDAFIILIWVLMFGLGSSSGSMKGITFASFIAFIFAVILSRLDMVHPVIVVTLIILGVIGAILSTKESSY